MKIGYINTYVSLMYELKEMERYLRVNLQGPSPRLLKKEFTGPRSHRCRETLQQAVQRMRVGYINTYVSLMYELKKMERYLRVNVQGQGPRLMKKEFTVSILSFHRVHYVVCFLLGISPASEV